MGDDQVGAYASRRTELDAQCRALPPAGATEYWRLIEDAEARQTLPLEVLARCFRERYAAGAFTDAERIFNVIWLPTIRRKAKYRLSESEDRAVRECQHLETARWTA